MQFFEAILFEVSAFHVIRFLSTSGVGNLQEQDITLNQMFEVVSIYGVVSFIRFCFITL